MTQRLVVYLQYSLRHLWREKRRAAFALFCVTAGVASIVGLQMLGLMVTDALTGDVRARNRGDVRVGPSADFWFTAEQMAAFERLVDAGLASGWTYRCFRDGLDVSVIRDQEAETYQFAVAFLVDPAVYPFYGQVRALDPGGRALGDLLTAPDDIVISKNLADRAKIAVGDRLRIKFYQASYDDSPLYTVRGIVPTYSATWSWNPVPAAFGFVYLDYDTAPWQALDLEPTASEVFFSTENEAQTVALAEKVAAIAPQVTRRTLSDLRAASKSESAKISVLVLVVGLLALLIGGVGIANTMQAVAARRRFEVAVLKALGLQGRHVLWLFLTDACLLGLTGGLAGVLLGLGISRALHEVAMSFLSAPVVWRVYPQPLLMGIVVGVTVTVIFSVLPALAAAQTRPLLALRPHSGGLPRLGCGQSLAGVLFLTGTMGLLAGQLLQDALMGVVGAYAVLVLLAVLTVPLRFIVWVIEKLPSLGWILLRLAQRGVGRNRARAAATLLALSVGLFSVSLIVILSNTVLDALSSTYIDSIGGDLLVWPLSEADWEPTLQTLRTSPQVASFTRVDKFEAELIAINGDPDAYQQRIALYERQVRGSPLPPQERADMREHLSKLAGRDLNSNLPQFKLLPEMGRNIAPQDSGQPVALFVDVPATALLKLQPGDRLTFRLDGGAEITLELVGVTDSMLGDYSMGSFVVSRDVLASLAEPDVRQFVADVNPKERGKAVTALSRSLLDRAVVMEANVITTFYGNIMRQFIPLPIAIAALLLFAAATMIANTAVLSVMERRQEIGVMKAVGVKDWQILCQLLLEGALIGLVGGVVVVGPITLLLKLVLEENGLPANIDPWPVLGMLALSIGVTLAATLVTAWPASRQRPLDVLRYE